MIYQINKADIQSAIQQNAYIVCWSTTGDFVLVNAVEDLHHIDWIDVYTDNDLISLMQMELWKQPCPAC